MWDVLQVNLASPLALAFVLGIVSRLLKSELSLPRDLYASLSIYLLLALGLKGGVELSHTSLNSLLWPAVVTVGLGLFTPVSAYLVLRRLGRFPIADAAGIAAHYGSVSAVTFIAAQQFVQTMNQPAEGFLPTLLTLLEFPGIQLALAIGAVQMARERAAQQAGLKSIPAIVRDTTDDNLLRDALLENIHRAQLNPLEEAAAYQQLLEEFDVTHEELAGRIGRSRPVISNMIRLLRLPIAVQRRVAAGVLSAGHARALLALDAGPEAQEELAARIVAEGLSVRATEEAVTLANRDDSKPSKPSRRKPIKMPGLQDIAERISRSYDTRVTVSLGKRKGKIVVEFGSVEDLQRIVALMDPGAAK